MEGSDGVELDERKMTILQAIIKSRRIEPKQKYRGIYINPAVSIIIYSVVYL